MGRLIKGRIAYLVEDGGGYREFGREVFSISAHNNGVRTLRVVCEFDEERILRDVVYTVDARFRPVDAYVRIANGSAVGSGWFRFTDTYAEGESHTAEEGRISQHIAITEPVRAFGSHPICSDIWRLSQLNKTGIDQPQLLTNCMNSSALAAGESGPTLSQREYTYIYRGPDTVTVEAGTFDCHRFDWPVRDGKTLCMWTSGDDYVPVRMTFPEGRKRYDLTSLWVRED